MHIRHFVDSAVRRCLVVSIAVAPPAIGFAQDVQWTREFGSRREEILAMAVSATGLYTAGDTTVFAPPFDDGFVLTFDHNGSPGWGRRPATEHTDRASAIVANASGVFVAGATQGTLPGQTSAGDADGFLLRYNLDGTEVWRRQFGSNSHDEVLGIRVDTTGVYAADAAGGALPGQESHGSVDAFVVKLR